jgi:hypothetical protein
LANVQVVSEIYPPDFPKSGLKRHIPPSGAFSTTIVNINGTEFTGCLLAHYEGELQTPTANGSGQNYTWRFGYSGVCSDEGKKLQLVGIANASDDTPPKIFPAPGTSSNELIQWLRDTKNFMNAPLNEDHPGQKTLPGQMKPWYRPDTEQYRLGEAIPVAETKEYIAHEAIDASVYKTRSDMRDRVQDDYGNVFGQVLAEAIIIKALLETGYGTCLLPDPSELDGSNATLNSGGVANSKPLTISEKRTEIYDVVNHIIYNIGSLMDQNPSTKLYTDTPLIEERLASDLKELQSFGDIELSDIFTAKEEGWIGRCDPGSGEIPSLAAELWGWASSPDRPHPSETVLEKLSRPYGDPFKKAGTAVAK